MTTDSTNLHNRQSHKTYLAPQAANCYCSGAMCHIWKRRTAIRSPGLPFHILCPNNPCNYMDYYSFTDPRGKEGWVGLVGWPTVDSVPTKWSPVNHRSGKVRRLNYTPPTYTWNNHRLLWL